MFSSKTITERLKDRNYLHAVNHRPLTGYSFPLFEIAVFGMGCFWGVEKLFWEQSGVLVTMTGYCGGHTSDPDYDEVCSAMTGHAEVVRVVFDPTVINYSELLVLFWENHNPTQKGRQGNDIGSQYRSCIFCQNEQQRKIANASKDRYQKALLEKNLKDSIVTEINTPHPFYYAEEHHQQYLAKNPAGYCHLNNTGILMPE